VGAISGIGGYVRAADGEPTAAFHERLKGGTGERRGLRAHRTFRGDPARGSAAEVRSGGSMTGPFRQLADRGNCSDATDSDDAGVRSAKSPAGEGPAR
jgi:hypothetical protein